MGLAMDIFLVSLDIHHVRLLVSASLRPYLVELWLWKKAVVGCELWKSCCGL